MLQFLMDENFDQKIARGLLAREPGLDFVLIHDVGLAGKDDPTILEWAAQEGRVLLTHDVKTMTKFAYDRVRAGLPMPGVFKVNPQRSTKDQIEAILLLVLASNEGEWENQVLFLPW